MDKNLFLIHDQSGMGVDFDVLDLIIMEDRIFVVLAPATADDSVICSTMMEGLEATAPEPGGKGNEDRNVSDVCILEMQEDKDGRGCYLRVENDTLKEAFQIFRKRNQHRFRFD